MPLPINAEFLALNPGSTLVYRDWAIEHEQPGGPRSSRYTIRRPGDDAPTLATQSLLGAVVWIESRDAPAREAAEVRRRQRRAEYVADYTARRDAYRPPVGA